STRSSPIASPACTSCPGATCGCHQPTIGLTRSTSSLAPDASARGAAVAVSTGACSLPVVTAIPLRPSSQASHQLAEVVHGPDARVLHPPVAGALVGHLDQVAQPVAQPGQLDDLVGVHLAGGDE